MKPLPPALSEVIPVIAALVGAGFGFLASRLSRSRSNGDVERLSAEIGRLESQSREQARQVQKLRGEQRALSNLWRTLPEIVSKLNNAELDEKEIPGHMFALANAIFEPKQMFLYLTGQDEGRRDNDSTLYLANHAGASDGPTPPTKIGVGDGKIGWVASTKVEMRAEDWLNRSRMEGQSIADNHPSLRFDLIGPIVSHEGGQARLLGVLCIESLGVHPENEKLMLKMVTNVATIAYNNSRNTKALKGLANHDGLTQLLNKRYFMVIRLGELINAAERDGSPLSLFIFDIDHFKKYNDSNGHLAGDEILKLVSKVLRENLRPGDVACRYGGEEFIVAMPGANAPDGLAAAERIRAAIAETDFPRAESQPSGRVTISGGVARFPIDGTGGTDLILHADEALYKAKAGGRNRVLPYQSVDIGGDGKDEPVWVPNAEGPQER